MTGSSTIKNQIQQLINENKVMVFSGTYCPYCTKAKKILGKYKLTSYKVLELDHIEDGDAYQEELGRMTGASTVPRVFIAGKCIGGGDDTEHLEKKGELEKKLKEAGALEE